MVAVGGGEALRIEDALLSTIGALIRSENICLKLRECGVRDSRGQPLMERIEILFKCVECVLEKVERNVSSHF